MSNNEWMDKIFDDNEVCRTTNTVIHFLNKSKKGCERVENALTFIVFVLYLQHFKSTLFNTEIKVNRHGIYFEGLTSKSNDKLWFGKAGEYYNVWLLENYNSYNHPEWSKESIRNFIKDVCDYFNKYEPYELLSILFDEHGIIFNKLKSLNISIEQFRSSDDKIEITLEDIKQFGGK